MRNGEKNKEILHDSKEKYMLYKKLTHVPLRSPNNAMTLTLTLTLRMALENVGDTLRCVSVEWMCLMIDSAKSHESFGRDMEREETASLQTDRWTATCHP